MISYFENKKYNMPKNIPLQNTHKYQEVIDKGWAKYLEIINLSGNHMIYSQFYELLSFFEGKSLTKKSNEEKARGIIQRLEILGFLSTDFIGRNKFLSLKSSAISFSTGDYEHGQRVSLNKDLRDERFKMVIMHAEIFLKLKRSFTSEIMMEQLKIITKEILNKIHQTGNKYGYAVRQIEEILNKNDYLEIKDYLEEHSEYYYKLDIVRSMWRDLGMFYRNLLLSRQTISPLPNILEYYVLADGRVILHYAPKILIFDVSFSQRYYTDRIGVFFHAFFNIEGNELRDVQKTFIASRQGSLGTKTEHRIGYSVLIFGDNERTLDLKKDLFDQEIGSAINSPMIKEAETCFLNIEKYFIHPNSKRNKTLKNADKKISQEILLSLGISEKASLEKKNVVKSKNIMDLLNI